MGINLNSLETIVQRVAPSAKAVFKGSAKAREAMCAQKAEEIYKMLEPSFLNNSGVTKKEIEEAYRKLLPNVKIEVLENTDSTCYGSVMRIFSKDTVVGYKVNLPFSSCLNSGSALVEDVNTFQHETRHLLDKVFKYKDAARTNSMSAINNIEGFAGRSSKYNDFYKDKIYSEEVDIFSISPQERLTLFKKDLKEVFADKNISASEKAEVLQNWRHRAMSELNAFRDGISYSEKLETNREIAAFKRGLNDAKLPDWASDITKDDYAKIHIETLLESSERTVKSRLKYNVNEKYFYEEKINAMEEMLAGEIKQEREKMARNFFLFGSVSRPNSLIA